MKGMANMITKSKNTLAAEKELAALNARLTKAKIDLDREFETAESGERLPGMTATVTLLERRHIKLAAELHAALVSDALDAVTRAMAAHNTAVTKCAAGKAKHLAECIAAHPKKPSVGRKLGKDRDLAPEWLRELRQKRHDTHAGIMLAVRDLRDLDPEQATRLGMTPIDAWTPPKPLGPVEA
jgi:hypothetical protein